MWGTIMARAREGDLLLDRTLHPAGDEVEAADLQDPLLQAAQLSAAEDAAEQPGDGREADEHGIAGGRDGVPEEHTHNLARPPGAPCPR